mmetsp:Transcript_95903/g.266415  ORF Transcript_95903/g.266415 Transcript_95903/m.266415 type:complete len:337 (-) Transcript_95903:288-1298(-)
MPCSFSLSLRSGRSDTAALLARFKPPEVPPVGVLVDDANDQLRDRGDCGRWRGVPAVDVLASELPLCRRSSGARPTCSDRASPKEPPRVTPHCASVLSSAYLSTSALATLPLRSYAEPGRCCEARVQASFVSSGAGALGFTATTSTSPSPPSASRSASCSTAHTVPMPFGTTKAQFLTSMPYAAHAAHDAACASTTGTKMADASLRSTTCHSRETGTSQQAREDPLATKESAASLACASRPPRLAGARKKPSREAASRPRTTLRSVRSMPLLRTSADTACKSWNSSRCASHVSPSCGDSSPSSWDISRTAVKQNQSHIAMGTTQARKSHTSPRKRL